MWRSAVDRKKALRQVSNELASHRKRVLSMVADLTQRAAVEACDGASMHWDSVQNRERGVIE